MSRLAQGRGRATRVLAMGLVAMVLLLAKPAHAAIQYVHTDALGSPVAVTDEERTVLERVEYEPYGKSLSGPVKDGPGFTGHVSDAATGLSYMQQRYYDPEIGRFLSVDPVAVAPSAYNFNRYSYALDNPYRFTDPDGRDPSDPNQQDATQEQTERRYSSGRGPGTSGGTQSQFRIDGAIAGSRYNTTNQNESVSNEQGAANSARAARALVDAANNSVGAASAAAPTERGAWVAGRNAAITRWVGATTKDLRAARALGRVSGGLGVLSMGLDGVNLTQAALSGDGMGMLSSGAGLTFGAAGLTSVGLPGSITYGATSYFMQNTQAGQNFTLWMTDKMCTASGNC